MNAFAFILGIMWGSIVTLLFYILKTLTKIADKLEESDSTN